MKQFLCGLTMLCLAIGPTGCFSNRDAANTSDSQSSDPNAKSTSSAPESTNTDAVELANGATTTQSIATANELPAVPGLGDQQRFVPLADVILNVDPTQDQGWESEAFNEAAGKQLHRFDEILRDPALLASQSSDLVADQFECGLLRPARQSVFADPALSVDRAPENATASSSSLETIYRGHEGFREAVHELLAVFGKNVPEHVHTKFKVTRVELASESATTEAYFELSGETSTGIVQVNATWTCRWTRGKDDSEPKLLWIGVRDYEEIQPQGKTFPLFKDCTEAILGATDAYRQQLAYGADFWYGNLDVAFGIRQGNQGLAVGDINGDGRDDLYVCQPAGLPNRVFVQRPDGKLKEVTRESDADWLDLSRSALFVDLDNDGDQDLVVVLKWSLVVHANDGHGNFRVATIIDTKFNLMSLSAVDYDADGKLDLYACGYSPGPEGSPTDIFANPVPYHDANNGARNFLLRNEGQLSFADVTAAVGLEQNNRRFSFAASWEDFDNDGDPDLYVANDFGRNNLYRNDDGHFVDVAAEAGVEDIAAGMSVSWADYDHDGQMDVYVSNMFSSAGNRIAYQRQFKPDADDATRRQLQRHARGNTLFRNLGDGHFEDVSVAAGVTMGRWAWGSLFVDLNNDGWEDLYVTNGFYTSEDTGDL